MSSLATHPLAASDSAKYVPYTPRQRTVTTTSTSTSKPQLASLRAAAEGIGLDGGTVGWAILDKIAYEGDASDDWAEIWHALTKAKATLLLPSEPLLVDLITPEFVQDHLVLDSDTAQLVTLSGLRAHRFPDALAFRSTIHRSTALFRRLSARTLSLDALPPLPALPLESNYPVVALSVAAPAAVLPLPARATKPPLPPRPGVRPPPPSSAPRLPTFASLFGQRPSTPPPPTTTTTTTTALPETDATIDISALVVDTALSRSDIATAITSALKAEIAIALSDQPPWLVERVHAFALPYFPFLRQPPGKKKLQDIGGNTVRLVYAINGTLDEPDALTHKFQSFYSAVELELRKGDLDEAHVRDVLETVEATLCTLLYDRLFLPLTSDDASHNEALSSRIAALNMLDLRLDHLDIDIGDASQAEVDAVVRACGETLAQLDTTARSPREKAAVLVSAHKRVVEGLSKIPPIRLKSRDDTQPKRASGPTEHSENQGASVPIASPDPSVTESPPSEPVSGDVLLPILIFSVVKANPQRLVSHLLFTQRFRNLSFGGEESYCLINLMAVAEFLENVDLGALGLGESEKRVISTADLTPIPIARPIPEPSAAGDAHSASIRGRVGQSVDVIAGSANKVISGVVDSSFGVLRAFLPGQGPGSALAGSGSGTATGTERPGLGLLRRESTFSIAGLTAALPGGRARGGQPEEGQRELVEVTLRPPSLRTCEDGSEGSEESEEHASVQESEGEESEEEVKEEEGEADDGDDDDEGEAHDTRSIKSFESMLSSGRRKVKTDASSKQRRRLTDLTDRLAHGVAGMSRRVQGGDGGPRATTWPGRLLPLPHRRFAECTEQDLRVCEAGELLREYQRLVEAVRSAGGFQE